MRCVSHRLAQQDLLNAIAYYDEQTPGLGAEFLEAFDEAVAFIRRYPEGAPAVRGQIRRLVMPRFPYNIIYRLAGDHLRVLAVAHQRRSDQFWSDRS